jgi:glucoside 3-dehydrogenase (cytochrome c) hitch-hiker subunit
MTEDNNETDTIARDGESDLTRREMIKLGASAALVVALTRVDVNAAAQAAQARAPLFFTKQDLALVDELSELIIPADDHSPGARAALVAEYIDLRLSEAFEEAERTQWRDGLKRIEQLSQEMHGKSFLESSPAQRIALLTRISANEMHPSSPEESFFKELKSRTAHAYYTSKIGIHTEMEYKGNVYLKEFVGYDAT